MKIQVQFYVLFTIIFQFAKAVLNKNHLQIQTMTNANDRLEAQAYMKIKERQDESGKTEEEEPFWEMRGWLKYIQEKPSEDMPVRFLKNPGYFQQMQIDPNTNIVEQDAHGYLNIPDDHHFYAMMTEESFYLVDARRNDLAKTHISLDFKNLKELMKPSNDLEKESGGLLDLGGFQEGFCFKMTTRDDIEYTLCSDDPNDKDQWYEHILKYVIVKQKRQSGQAGLMSSEAVDVPDGFEFGVKHELKKQKDVDGQWITLKSWSGCTLACGGGKSYLQRMCIPPTGNGQQCQGEPILEKNCNEFACPKNKVDDKIKLLDPIIKVIPVSDRFQRFELCVVREGDMFVQLKAGGFGDMELPVRVILNNRTISIFSMPKYNYVYQSFDLSNLALDKDPRPEFKNKCFKLTDQRVHIKTATLCVMPTGLRKGETIEGAKTQWMKDIVTFRDLCRPETKWTDIPKSPFVDGEDKKMNKDKEEYETSEQEFDKIIKKDNKKVIEKTSVNAENAIETEIKYDRLKREEMIDLQQLMQQQLKGQIDNQEDKIESCEKKEEKEENEDLLQKMQDENNNVKKMFEDSEKKTIIETRNSANWELQKDKIIAARKLKAQKERLYTIREEMSTEVVNDHKMGNMKNCDVKKPEADQKKFCEEHYGKRPYIFMDCVKGSQQYCFACCEYEFGSLLLKDRERCYKYCLGIEDDGSGGYKIPPAPPKGWVQLSQTDKIGKRLQQIVKNSKKNKV